MDRFFELRPATESDFPEIKALIRQVRINPTRLDWRHFTVAVSGPALPAPVPPWPDRQDRQAQVSEVEGGGLIGCAQLKPVPPGLTELASLAVRPAYRHQGVARALIERLLADSPRPLYLTCRSGLGELYTKFGFQVVGAEDMPRYYRRLQRLADTLLGLTRRDETLLVMKLG